MTIPVESRINDFDDFQVVKFFQYFATEMLKGISVDSATMLSNVASEVLEEDDFRLVTNISLEQARMSLPAKESSLVARPMLQSIASDPTLRPALEHALDSFRDEELFLEIALGIGLVASMVLLVATTSVEGTILGIKFKKETASPEQISAVVKPLASLLPTSAGD